MTDGNAYATSVAVVLRAAVDLGVIELPVAFALAASIDEMAAILRGIEFVDGLVEEIEAEVANEQS